MARPPGAPIAGELLRLGLARQRGGHLNEAEQLYRQVLAVDRTEPNALHLLGVIAHQRGRHDEAARLIQRALRRQPHGASFHHNLGDAQSALGRQGAARDAYRRALVLGPDAADTVSNLGVAALTRGAWDDAIRTFRRASRLAPARAQLHLGLAHALKGAGNVEQARTACVDALGLDPGLDEARFLLAALGGGKAPDRAPAGYVRDLFDKYAEGFEHHLVGKLGYRTPELIAAALARALGAQAPSGRRTVDLGCGTGLMGRLLRKQASRLIGVDLSPRMIEASRALGQYDELVLADAGSALAALPSGSADLIVAADVLVYLGALDGLFAAAARALASGGALAVSTEDADQPPYALKASLRYGHAPGYVETAAAAAGLTCVLVEPAVLRRQDEVDLTGTIHVFIKD
jgi:predicted TPR repeat methyltransferase